MIDVVNMPIVSRGFPDRQELRYFFGQSAQVGEEIFLFLFTSSSLLLSTLTRMPLSTRASGSKKRPTSPSTKGSERQSKSGFSTAEAKALKELKAKKKAVEASKLEAEKQGKFFLLFFTTIETRTTI